MFDTNSYRQINLNVSQSIEIKGVVSDYVNSMSGSVDDEKRSRLSRLSKMVPSAVSYVMGNLPVDVERVDGFVIRPILKEVCSEKILQLPTGSVEN